MARQRIDATMQNRQAIGFRGEIAVNDQYVCLFYVCLIRPRLLLPSE